MRPIHERPPPRQTAPENTWPITAIALEGRLDWASFTPDPEWREQRRLAYGRSYELADGSLLFLFGFGAAVCERARPLPGDLRAAIEASAQRRLLAETEETHYIAVDPENAEPTPRVAWDRVVIRERRPELVAAVALLLGQSAALERFELAVDSVLDRTLDLSRDLARRGRLPRGTRELTERLGRLTGDRLELARWFFLVDRPEDTWEDPGVAQLHDALFANLELRHRHDAMLHKLGAAERATETVVDLWQGRRSNALEWAIVLLIVVEIAFGIWGLV